jgi:Ni,Fe-hydrogenase maturation factor
MQVSILVACGSTEGEVCHDIYAVEVLTTIEQEFLKGKGEPVSGKKDDLIERVAEWLDRH